MASMRSDLERWLGSPDRPAASRGGEAPDAGELLRLILDVLARQGLVEPVEAPVDDESRREFLRHPERLAPFLPLVEVLGRDATGGLAPVRPSA